MVPLRDTLLGRIKDLGRRWQSNQARQGLSTQLALRTRAWKHNPMPGRQLGGPYMLKPRLAPHDLKCDFAISPLGSSPMPVQQTRVSHPSHVARKLSQASA
jgi:hypothetical protein